MHNGQNILSTSSALLFSLGSTNERVLSATALELTIENAIGTDIFWESRVPKKSGEFLVYGAAYSAQATRGLGVSVNVGDVFKIVMIFGDRTWTQFGISEAIPFKITPINYNYAFGGNNYSLNPIGKGYASTAELISQLPNIESPNQLIVSKFDKPEPIGFEPYPPEWPQRSQHFLNYKDIDLSATILHLPNEIKPEHFYTAPLDQRMEDFFQGHEKIEIKNMHPLRPTINSSLPRIRLRQFVIQKNAHNEEEFRELGVRNDTLSLLPNLEYGILTYRSTCNIENMTASEVSYLFSVLESLDEEPKSVEYYFQSLVANGTIQTEDSNAVEPNEKVKPNLAAQNNPETNSANQDKTTQELFTEIISSSKVQNITLEKLSQQLEHLNDDAMGLNTLGKHVIDEVQKMLQKFSLTEQDLNQYTQQRQAVGLLTIPSEEELIEQLQKIGLNNPELEKSLRDNMKTLTEAMQKLDSLDQQLTTES